MIIFYNERDNGAYVRLFANGAAIDMDVILKLEIQVTGQSFNTIDHPDVVRRDGDKYAITLGAAGIAPGTYGMEILAYSTDKPLGVVWGPPIKIVVRQMTGPTPTPAPVFLTQPSITGTSQVGQVLTAVDGTASNTTTLTRKWYMDDAEIVGETGASYTLVTGDVGKVPGLRNFATGPGGGPVQSSLATAAAVLPVFLRQVGTRCVLPRQRLSTDKQFNSRSFHRVPGGVIDPVITFPGYMGANNVSTPTGDGDLGMGGDMSLRASVEYPAGTFTRLKFSAGETGTVLDLGELSSDPAVGLTLPDNAGFWIWVNGSFAGAGTPVMFSSRPQDNNYSLLGEALERGASGITDKSGGGTITTIAGSPGLVYRPIKIMGQVAPSRRAFAVVGDSKEAGFGSLFGEHDADGQLGVIARAVSSSHGVTVCAIGGDQGRVWDSPARVASRSKLLDPVTDVIIALGINDVSNGQTLAQIIASLSTIRDVAVSKGKRVGRKTIEPRTASTDSFRTATAQTTQSNESVRVAANAWIRNPANWPSDSYLIDVADMVEVNTSNVLTRDGGRWISTGTANENVFDGIHLTLKLILDIKPAVRAAIGL